MLCTRKELTIAVICFCIGTAIGLLYLVDKAKTLDAKQLRQREDIQRMLEGDTVTLTEASVNSVAIVRVNKRPYVQALCRDTSFYANGYTSTYKLCHDVFILDTSATASTSR